MKLKGPFKEQELSDGRWVVVDGQGFSIATATSIDGTLRQCKAHARRIAAALNAAETPIGKVAEFATNGGLDKFRRSKRTHTRKERR